MATAYSMMYFGSFSRSSQVTLPLAISWHNQSASNQCVGLVVVGLADALDDLMRDLSSVGCVRDQLDVQRFIRPLGGEGTIGPSLP